MIQRERNAMELALYVMVALVTAPTALGFQPLPASLENGPALFGRASVVAMWIGCLGCLLGMFWRDLDDGITIQEIALACLALGTHFYAAALILAGAPFATWAIAVAFSLAIGQGAAWRFGQLWFRMRRRIAHHETS